MTDSIIMLTDLDNTLYSWIDYFGPCFRAMVRALAHVTALEDAEIYQQFKAVYARSQTAEYHHAIQELEVFKRATRQSKAQLLRAGITAFGCARKEHLRAYAGVPSTMEYLREQGVRMVCVTNSWIVDASRRLEWLGIDKYLDGLVAWNGEQGRGGQPRLETRSRIRFVLPIESIYRKPSSVCYQLAVEECGMTSARIVVVGDSIAQDLEPARTLGAITVWARYGTQFDKANFETIVRVTHWGPDQIAAVYNTTAMIPDFTADRFADVGILAGSKGGAKVTAAAGTGKVK